MNMEPADHESRFVSLVSSREPTPNLWTDASGLGPAERGAFTIGIARSLAPGRQQVEALLGFSVFARIYRMHIEAVGAAIDLGSTNLHKLGKGRFEARSNGIRCAEPGPHELRSRGEGIEFGGHDGFPSVGTGIMARQELPV